MIRYQKIEGANLQNANGLPSIVQTEEGKAIGAIPGWSFMIQPEYMQSGHPLDRVNGKYTAVDNPAIKGNFPNGADSFDISARGAVSASGTVDINPDEWTFFSAFNINADTSFLDFIRPSSTVAGVALRVTYVASADGIYVYNNSTPSEGSRLASTGSIAGSPGMLMVTFSVERGIRLYINGELDGEDPDDNRPLDTAFRAGEWVLIRRTFSSSDTHVGMSGFLSTDLSSPQNAGYRRAIERFLMTKYGIPKGPQ